MGKHLELLVWAAERHLWDAIGAHLSSFPSHSGSPISSPSLAVMGGGSWCGLALKSSFLRNSVDQTDHHREQKQRHYNSRDYIERHDTFRC